MRLQLERACNEIIKFDSRMKRLFGENPLRKQLMGKYGELLVASLFKRRGHKISTEAAGNLTSYDLIVDGRKIEVRTSEIKKERAFPDPIRAWGWKLQTNDKNGAPKNLKYDFIILVRLFNRWDRFKLYILSKKQVMDVKVTRFRGYQTVARVIFLFKNPLRLARRLDSHRMITESCADFNRCPSKFQLKWNRIRTILSGAV